MSGTSVPADLNLDDHYMLYMTISLIAQTFFYGIYVVLILFSTYILLVKEGAKTRSTRFFLIALFIPFTFASLYWITEVAETIVRVQVFVFDPTQRNSINITTYADVFNAIVLFNYAFTDGVVVWRAWVLCRSEYRKRLFIPFVLLILTILSVFVTIGLKIATYLSADGPADSNPLTFEINAFQISNFVWSLLTNLSATSILSHKAWHHRRMIQEGLKNIQSKRTRTERVLLLLIESGFLYCLAGITVVVMSVIQLPAGTLGDIYFPVSVQIAGIYPTIVIVLVGLDQSLNRATFWQVETAERTQDTHSGLSKGRVKSDNFSSNADISSSRSLRLDTTSDILHQSTDLHSFDGSTGDNIV